MNRRARRAKADGGLDAWSAWSDCSFATAKAKTNVWSTVNVPDPADEDQRGMCTVSSINSGSYGRTISIALAACSAAIGDQSPGQLRLAPLS